ncbi:epoxyqueuosine reductase QueH [Anaerobium acetethylicum]|uniref:Epoxyqueuosine reductase QueH n=1 Tax=Anaerobium acetethylicum TaxID=1619234 RepID=A0A1D3TP88_9FIRM|nr:epoxyqueuosine reductase QueH [Anaerobium acetethylicum]SCP95159.1 hypothetical protein SAMN05421730_1001360 [Anaerobium acetethylicum]
MNGIPKRNYQKELDQITDALEKNGEVPRLLLHSCCAPCSSYVLEYLSAYFEITVYYYNPNIFPPEEYEKRAAEQREFADRLDVLHKISFLEGDYDTDLFYAETRGLEKEPEGGERCSRCFELRLRETAKRAREGGFDYFTTTLSISPHKNADQLNEIGKKISEETGIAYLYSDFKKKNGFKRSVELTAQYGMYRQDYCGCVFSKMEREKSLN